MTEQNAFYTSVMLYFIVSFLWMNKNVLKKKKGKQEHVSNHCDCVFRMCLHFIFQHSTKTLNDAQTTDW